MDSAITPSPQATIELIENANQFTEFLSSETVAPVRTSINIIPNIVADILEVVLQHEVLKTQDRQFERRAELGQRYLEIQNKHSQRQLELEVEKIHTQTKLTILELDQRRNIELTQIKRDEKIQIEMIEREEQVKIMEIRSKFELMQKQQENEKEMFQKALSESNQRFNRTMRNAEKIQEEFTQLIQVIMQKIVMGSATEYECRLLEQLSLLKIQALDKSFDISKGFLDMFIQGESYEK